jgi:predicted aldo/keto reductase-like oxidoreductase
VLLLSYNFMNRSEAEKVLAACKKNNVGATAMKTFPGVLKEVPPFDPENPDPVYLPQIRKRQASGMSPEQINRAVRGWANYRNKRRKATQELMQRYGMQTERQLWQASIKWARSNPDVHTLCISMTDFDEIEQAVGLSGSVLTGKERDLLGDYEVGFSDHYCRHGCSACLQSCHKDVPINTILRYACYFEQGRKEYASEKYHALGDCNAAQCSCCDAPCQGLCPYGLDIQNTLLNAHGTLAVT